MRDDDATNRTPWRERRFFENSKVGADVMCLISMMDGGSTLAGRLGQNGPFLSRSRRVTCCRSDEQTLVRNAESDCKV